MYIRHARSVCAKQSISPRVDVSETGRRIVGRQLHGEQQ